MIHKPVSRISRDFKTGSYGSLGPNARICPKVTFGNYVLVGPDLIIAGHDHVYTREGTPIIFSGRPFLPETFVGDDCWIGCRVTIIAGVSIGRGSVIGANAVVTKDIPPYSIVAGVPAKCIGQRFDHRSQLRAHDKMLASPPAILGKYAVPR
jgi:acetyltransferase-like isoleucine patch superfamily enzyme